MEAMGLESIRGSGMMCVATYKSAASNRTMALRTKFFCPFSNTMALRTHARQSRVRSVQSCYTAWEDKYRSLRLHAMDYLKQKGYGQLSLEQVKEQQNGLGIFNAQDRLSHDDEPFTSFSGVVPSKASYTRYLREKGFGLGSLEEVKEQQARLGIFHSDLVSHDNRASRCPLEGEQGLQLSTAFGEVLVDDSTHGVYGRGQPISHVEYGMFAPWIDQFKTSTNSKSKGVVANYSKKSQSSIQGRQIWILDACFVIDLLREPRTENERIACDACCKAFQHMQEQGAELVMPEVCVAEAAYILEKQGIEHRLVEVIVGGIFKIISMQDGDWKRVQELLDIYGPRFHVGIVDCCLTATAESLKIVNVATSDYRHLQRLIKPKHCEMFNILP